MICRAAGCGLTCSPASRRSSRRKHSRRRSEIRKQAKFSTALHRAKYISRSIFQRESRHKCELAFPKLKQINCLCSPATPLRREGRSVSAEPVCSCAFLLCGSGTRAARTRSSLRPCDIEEGKVDANLG